MNAAASQRSPDPYHIASHSAHADADASSYTLNHADTFAVLDRWGDANGAEGGSMGIYHRDTRYLSQLQAHVNGVRPVLLTSTARAAIAVATTAPAMNAAACDARDTCEL